MDCQEFLSSYTDYRDGLLSEKDVARMEVHLSGCPSCRRYMKVVDEGVEELRSLPDVTATEDFRPRLQHRIYHVADEEAFLEDGSRGSGTTAVAAVGIAILLTVAAWTPVLRQAGSTVTLPAIVVSQPPGSSVRAEIRLPPSAFFRSADSWRRSSAPRWSPPTSVWTASATSSSPPGIRVSPSMVSTASTDPMSPGALSSTSTGSVRFLGSSGISLSPPTPRPAYFQTGSSRLESGSGRLNLGLD